MTFAVLICNYNHSKFIVEAILSAMRSKLVDTVFFTDDGSTDDSVLKVEELSKKFVKLRVLKDDWGNIGYSERVNRYSDRLKEFDTFLLLDSDDRIIPGGLSVALRRMEKDRFQVLFGATSLINEAGNPTGIIDGINTPAFLYPDEISNCYLNKCIDTNCDPILTTLLNQNWVRTTSNILFSRSSIDHIFPIPSVRTNPDWHIALSLALTQSCFYTNIPFSEHRIHCNKVTSSRIDDSRSDTKQIFETIDLNSLSQNPHAQIALSTNPYLT
jgi:glycosyltransferase involved in cell wall biosynthesis